MDPVTNQNLAYAIRLIHAACCLGGSASFVDDLRADVQRRGITRAARDHDTPALFDWLVKTLSFQGVSDSVADSYIAEHGTVTWADITEALSRLPSCPKLRGYWTFTDCRFQKTAKACSEPRHFDRCPLPLPLLRNGRLNQMAYSLFFFIRDVADGDLVAWIDQQLFAANTDAPARLINLREAVIGPLRNVYGLSDKVLAMALSFLLFAGGRRRRLWTEVAATFVAVDTLVHNFMHRTGILRRFGADHPYGDRCYGPGGCARIIDLIAAHIDAREFNAAFPAIFPRFVQSAIWAHCAEPGLDICNGNRIDDTTRAVSAVSSMRSHRFA